MLDTAMSMALVTWRLRASERPSWSHIIAPVSPVFPHHLQRLERCEDESFRNVTTDSMGGDAMRRPEVETPCF